MFYKNPDKLHGIGKIQYPSRIIGIGLGVFVFAVNQWLFGTLYEIQNLCVIGFGIIYPHLALYVYWKSNSNKQIETNMLLVDAFLSGILLPFVGFNPLPSIVFASFTAAGTMVAKGVKHFTKGIIAIGVGIFVGWAILNFNIEFQNHLELELIIAISIFIVLYTTLFSFAANQFVVQIIKHKRKIGEQQKIIEQQHNDILDSINYAKRIQQAILPSDKVWRKNLPNSFVLYIPKDVVAGDFYWTKKVGNSILFAAADCTGHGVPGAMVSVVCSNALNRSIKEYKLSDPGEILTKTRELVIEDLSSKNDSVKDGMDIALCSLEENTLKYAGAHNPLWLIRAGKNEIEELKADKQPIGKFGSAKPFTTHEITLQTGDSFYIFSDGFADQFGGEKGKKFKTKNFKALLLSIQSKSKEQQKELIKDSFDQWKGEIEQLDDICVIGVQI